MGGLLLAVDKTGFGAVDSHSNSGILYQLFQGPRVVRVVMGQHYQPYLLWRKSQSPQSGGHQRPATPGSGVHQDGAILAPNHRHFCSQGWYLVHAWGDYGRPDRDHSPSLCYCQTKRRPH